MISEDYGYSIKISKAKYPSTVRELNINQKEALKQFRVWNRETQSYHLNYIPSDESQSYAWQASRIEYLKTLYKLIYQPYGGQTNTAKKRALHHGSTVDIPLTFYKKARGWNYSQPVTSFEEPTEAEKAKKLLESKIRKALGATPKFTNEVPLEKTPHSTVYEAYLPNSLGV